METVPRHLAGVSLRWRRLAIAEQYLLAGATGTVLICLLIGALVNSFLVHHELEDRSSKTAIFLEGVFSPILQGLAEEGRLSAEDIGRVNALMNNAEFSRRFPHLEIWLPSGEVAYSNSELIAGRQFDLPQQAQEAFDGEVAISFSDLAAEQHLLRDFSFGLLEVYAPIHRLDGADVIAVVEIHESAESLRQSLQRAALIGWGAVSVSGLLAFFLLLVFVLKASRTIVAQQRALSDRMRSSIQLLARFGEVEKASREASEKAQKLADKRLRIASADLHDGPSQLISYALLKARESKQIMDAAVRRRTIDALETALVTALSEIRSIGHGLVLPDLAVLEVDAVIELAVAAHVKRTGMAVQRDGSLGNLAIGLEHKICLFRLVQEGLNNANRHAGGCEALVRARRTPEAFEIEVVNDLMPGHTLGTQEGSGMGIEGLRTRVEVLGGSFSAGVDGEQFVICAWFELEAA